MKSASGHQRLASIMFGLTAGIGVLLLGNGNQEIVAWPAAIWVALLFWPGTLRGDVKKTRESQGSGRRLLSRYGLLATALMLLGVELVLVGVTIAAKPKSGKSDVLDRMAHAENLVRESRPRTDRSIKTPGVRREFPLANATLREIREMRPSRPSPPKHLDWMLETAKSYRAQGYATSCWLDCGFFETACWLRGYEQTAIDLIAEPDIVRALCDVWLEEKLHRIEVTARPLAPYIDLFCFGDDLAIQTDLFMSPGTFRDVLRPYYVAQYGRLHEVAPDSYIHHHSCGAVSKLIEDFIDIGIDVLNPIQPNAAGRLCYHGGIDLQWLLPFGSPEEVAAETEERMAILCDGGGYICAAAHSLPDDVPAANIIALFSARRPGGGTR
ncbi:MAG: hypothetical protein HQ592_10920 [Planctomycetes bacterium]|nr:hypothetical protein [Planctomycetota bacterium]